MEKTCRKCCLTKDVTEFYAYKPNKDGITSWCKRCYCDTKSRDYKRVECECGKMVIKQNYNKHLETNIHKKLVKKFIICNICKTFEPTEHNAEELPRICETCDGMLFDISQSYPDKFNHIMKKFPKTY